MKKLLLFGLLAIALSCTPKEEQPGLSKTEAIQQIYDVEQAFNDLLAKEGPAEACRASDPRRRGRDPGSPSLCSGRDKELFQTEAEPRTLCRWCSNRSLPQAQSWTALLPSTLPPFAERRRSVLPVPRVRAGACRGGGFTSPFVQLVRTKLAAGSVLCGEPKSAEVSNLTASL